MGIDWTQFQDNQRVRLTFEGTWLTNGAESAFRPDGASRHVAIFLPGWIEFATAAELNSDEPAEDVIQVTDYTGPQDPYDDDAVTWGRVRKAGEFGPHSEWKGYKNGGKIYLEWPELVRRWGPLTPTMWDDHADEIGD